MTTPGRKSSTGAKRQPGRAKMRPSDARRAQVVPLLASGMTHKAIAAKLGVHDTTVTHWAADPDVAAGVADLQRSTIDEARTLLAAEAVRVAKALVAKGTKRNGVGDTKAMMGALSIVGLGGSSRVTVDARVTAVHDDALPLELAKALRDVLQDATAEMRADVRAELRAALGEDAT